MKHKKFSLWITVLFCLFIFGFGIALFAAPDKDFSEKENRYLAQFPRFSWQALISGQFMEGFEDYVVDQFPLRDGWINLKAWGERILGKSENNEVYFGTDGDQTLFAHFNALSSAELARRVEYVNKLAANTDASVYFSIIPDKSYAWSHLLPENAPNVDDGTMAQQAQVLTEGAQWIDLYGTLKGEDSFYRTDHHWTTMGAFEVYKVLMSAMQGTYTTPEGAPVQVSDCFYGTTWSSAGASWVKPDSIHTWVSEDGPITVERYPEGKPMAGELYDESCLEKKDKYSMFLGGNQPLCILRNEQARGGKLLVVRDSYSDTLAPFLAQDFEEVHLFDLRYNKTPLPQYVQENGIDRVLVLYSASNFTTDTNLFLMGMGGAK